LTERYARAFTYTSAIHGPHFRATSASIADLIAVSVLTLDAGGDEDVAIAALLHDVVATCGGQLRISDIRQRFGDRVADIVQGCGAASDDVDLLLITAAQEQRAAYVERLHECAPDVLLVRTALAVHTAGRLVTELHRNQGRVPTGQTVASFEDHLRAARLRGVSDELTIPLGLAVAELRRWSVGPPQ
jgi:(p)ppGpp synthase/HD superfamily hydrolase